jgi:predicted DNA-binding transcriptional regulator AlpA
MADILPFAHTVADSARQLLVVDARRLAAMLTVGVRTVRTWDAGGKIPSPVRIGGRVVWRVDEIRAA